ncbi:MAG: hypothetical protein D6828_00970 [Nitrospirae bacterium]|nr:MAG: hypothetical protein D6828_00970 [Nitrospirota bacterium]
MTALLVIEYLSGYPDPEEYGRVKRELKNATKRLKTEAAEAEEAIKALTKAKVAFNEAHAKRIHKFENIQAKAEEERDKWVSAIQVYRVANMQARRENKRPKSFERDPEEFIKIPPALQALDCGNCCYEEEGR